MNHRAAVEEVASAFAGGANLEALNRLLKRAEAIERTWAEVNPLVALKAMDVEIKIMALAMHHSPRGQGSMPFRGGVVFLPMTVEDV